MDVEIATSSPRKQNTRTQEFSRRMKAKTRLFNYTEETTSLRSGTPRHSFLPVHLLSEQRRVLMTDRTSLPVSTWKTRSDTEVHHGRNPRIVQFGKNLITRIKRRAWSRRGSGRPLSEAAAHPSPGTLDLSEQNQPQQADPLCTCASCVPAVTPTGPRLLGSGF